MKTTLRLLVLFLISCNISFGQALFVPNQGQWPEDFAFQLKLKTGAIFYEADGPKYHLIKPEDLQEIYGDEGHQHGQANAKVAHHHGFKQQFLGADIPKIYGQIKEKFYHNYFLGNDTSKWRGNVPVYAEMIYQGIYPKINIHYREHESHLKYDWVVLPGGNYQKIAWRYNDADSTWLENGQIVIATSAGLIYETLPAVYTKRGNKTQNVNGKFVKQGERYSFSLGSYNKNDTLVIDPTLIFGSYSGSTADNWGFTATYDAQGNLYGGGIVFGAGYPTNGGFQVNHANPTYNGPLSTKIGVDIGISKFSANGTSLLWSSYLGGNSNEQPHSMFVAPNNNLYIMGVTSSANFPKPAFGVQDTFKGGPYVEANNIPFPNGTDIFIVAINGSGSGLVAGTFLGGTANDGLCLDNPSNYGDRSRGEIIVEDNEVYIASTTLSGNFPTKNASQAANGGGHDAVLVKLNLSLNSLFYSTYFGGLNHEMGYGVKKGTNNTVYMCGSTRGTFPASTVGKLNPNFMGGNRDGYVASFNAGTGASTGATYIGTISYDQTFLIDLDKFNNVFVFGQTGANNYPVTPGSYSNPAGKQFIHKLDPTLSTTIFSTVFGTGRPNPDIVPTALNIDECQNIMLAGWGGNVNIGAPAGGGSVSGMATTANALQRNTDGSDFYFAVFSQNAKTLKYATFFGGAQSAEHVDGGTSRFDPQGTIYHAVCAGCGTRNDFPTTPGAVSRTNNSNNCNLGVMKIDFETDLRAIAKIDSASLDTNCQTLTFNLINTSRNANVYYWNLGNGVVSNQQNPTVTYVGFGTYVIKLVATDTVCNISDSLTITVDFTVGKKPLADFEISFERCDVFRSVKITNKSLRANKYIWSFGDGNTSILRTPQHQYATSGIYKVTLTAVDTTCGVADTLTKMVDFSNNIPAPEVVITPDTCFFGGIDVHYFNDSAWYSYEWNFGGIKDTSKYPSYRFRAKGMYAFSLTILDTLCNTKYEFLFNERIERIDNRVYIPNAFTPNRDNKNEYFYIAGNACVGNAHFQILNSFGGIVFETDKPFTEFWDGYIDGQPAQLDVYVYVFTSDYFTKRGIITVFY